MRIVRTALGALGLALFLAGCVSTPAKRETLKAEADVGRKGAIAMDAFHDMPGGYLREVDAIYVGGEAMPLERGPDLPAVFRQKVVYSRSMPASLATISEFVTRTYGVPVEVTSAASTAAASAPEDPVNQFLQGGAATTGGGAAGAGGAGGWFTLSYNGTLQGLLDLVTSRTGTTWYYDKGDRPRVVIDRFVSRTFYLATLPTRSNTTNEISNTSQAGGQQGGGGGGSGGQQAGMEASGGQTTSVTTSVDVITDTAATVKSMLSKDGQVSIDGSTPAITVTDTPVIVERVARYIESLNEHLTRQVALEVKVYSLDLTRGDQYGIDWSMIYQTLSGRYGITTRSAGNLGADTNALSLSVIDPSYNYNGSNMLLQALSTQGRLVAVKTVSVVTLSGRPAPVQVGRQVGYLARAATTLVSNAGAATSMETGTISPGFSMNFLPVILDDNKVLMQLSLNMSVLRQIRSIIGTDGTRVEAPEVDTKQFLQQVMLKSDSTLVMSGYDADDHNGDDRGLGSADFWLGGGSTNNSRSRTMLVILVTPRVI